MPEVDAARARAWAWFPAVSLSYQIHGGSGARGVFHSDSYQAQVALALLEGQSRRDVLVIHPDLGASESVHLATYQTSA